MKPTDPVGTARFDEATVQARLDALTRDVAYLVERQRKQEELFAEMTPILREVMASATGKLDALEKDGSIEFVQELGNVARQVMRSYTPDDVRAFGDAVTSILDTVRDWTQPSVLAIADQASRALQRADEVEPLGIVGMVRATKSDDVQKGMAVMLDVVAHLGRAAAAVAKVRATDAPAERPRGLGALAARGIKKSETKPAKKVLGVERPARPTARPAACATPRTTTPETASVIDGIAFGADGHMVDPKAWNRALAPKLASALGVTLEDAHYKLIDFARSDFEATGVSPNIRRITQGTGLSTKDVYVLFPKAPGRTIAKIAGLPKPAGCL